MPSMLFLALGQYCRTLTPVELGRQCCAHLPCQLCNIMRWYEHHLMDYAERHHQHRLAGLASYHPDKAAQRGHLNGQHCTICGALNKFFCQKKRV